MSRANNFYFQSYQQWHDAITTRCQIELTEQYARQRIVALQDMTDRSTREFRDKYGEDYLNQVIQWFERAASSE